MKCQDDWDDELKPSARFSAAVMRKAYRRVKDEYPRQCAAMESSISELHRIESYGVDDPDGAAATFGTVMAEIFAYGEDRWTEVLKALGFHLGKFIYLMDACMDLETDHKKGSYNPFSSYYGKDNELFFRSILSMVMGDAIRAFDIMPLVQDVGILKNVLCDGLWQQFNKKFKKEEGPLDESGSV